MLAARPRDNDVDLLVHHNFYVLGRKISELSSDLVMDRSTKRTIADKFGEIFPEVTVNLHVFLDENKSADYTSRKNELLKNVRIGF